jgi:hypothetical protein
VTHRPEIVNRALAPIDLVVSGPVFTASSVRGGRASAKYLPRSNAWQFMYERFYLFDADRVPDARISSIYMGACRFGIRKYHAEALIRIAAHMPPFYISTTRYLRGFMRPRQSEAIARLLRGVRASMAVRDTVLVDTSVHRVAQVRDVIDATGRIAVGQLVEN